MVKYEMFDISFSGDFSLCYHYTHPHTNERGRQPLPLTLIDVSILGFYLRFETDGVLKVHFPLSRKIVQCIGPLRCDFSSGLELILANFVFFHKKHRST